MLKTVDADIFMGLKCATPADGGGDYECLKALYAYVGAFLKDEALYGKPDREILSALYEDSLKRTGDVMERLRTKRNKASVIGGVIGGALFGAPAGAFVGWFMGLLKWFLTLEDPLGSIMYVEAPSMSSDVMTGAAAGLLMGAMAGYKLQDINESIDDIFSGSTTNLWKYLFKIPGSVVDFFSALGASIFGGLAEGVAAFSVIDAHAAKRRIFANKMYRARIKEVLTGIDCKPAD
jgi:hypothetical protein